MAAVTSLLIGMNTLVQNQVYALPGQDVLRISNATGNSLDTSNDPAFGTFVTIGSGFGNDVARQFIRMTGGGGIISVATSG